MIRSLVPCLLLLFVTQLQASEYPFTLHKLVSSRAGPTILVIGGIQGDEPGGFTAASLLVTDYEVSRGEVWVVPNLNFESILKRSRGVYGDMNRKFLQLQANDPEYNAVSKIKRIITDKQVDIILNLHDGSGFYSQDYIDADENPNRWGQSIVIDQSVIESERYADLEAIAQRVINTANSSVGTEREGFLLKNTRTSEGDKEMEKTLTYFAIRNGKAAMGVEASKSYPTEKRVINHLRFVEAMFTEIGIEFQRSFKLSARSIKRKLGRDIQLAIFDNKIVYDFDSARKTISYVPLKKSAGIEFSTNNPLVAIVNSSSQIKVRYGNRSVTTLKPEYFDYDYFLTDVGMIVDGVETRVPMGSMVAVEDEFLIQPIEDTRVNIIGYRKSGHRNESNLSVRKQEIGRRFSLDRQAQKFRVEFYRNNKYSGMILIDFSGKTRIGANRQKSASRL